MDSVSIRMEGKMSIETTINVRNDVRSAIDEASMSTGIARSRVVALVMRRLQKDYRALTRFCARMRYQERDEKKNWRTLHVCLAERDYEVFLDMRRFSRCSVSLLVACAVEKYMDKLIDLILGENNDGDTDNYLFQNYLIAQNIIDGVVCWHIYWGMPKKKELRRLFASS